MALSPSGVPSRAGIQAAIDEVAADVRGEVQRGRVDVPAIAAGAVDTVTVTFPAMFATTPNVTATAENSRLTAAVSAVTLTGFTLSFGNWSPAGAPATFAQWIATEL